MKNWKDGKYKMDGECFDCKPHYYGLQCNVECSNNCLDKICEKDGN